MLHPVNAETPVILNTILEHSSNDLPWRYIPGYDVIKLPVSNEGFWDLKGLEETLHSCNNDSSGHRKIRMVAVSGASNVLGSCNDLAATGTLAHRFGALFMVDAAHLVAHRPVNMVAEGIDCLAFSAHKIYAPFGTGVLVVRKGILRPEFLLSGKESTCGEENAAGIAALGKALLLIRSIGFNLIREEELRLMRRAMNGMLKIPGVEIRGVKDPGSLAMEKKIGIILFDLKNRMAGRIATKLAWHGGIGVRYGCHCAHLIIKQLTGFTPFLEKFQRTVVRIFPMLNLQGFLRISFGLGNSEEEVDQMVKVLGEIAEKKLQSSVPLREIHRVMEKHAEEVTERVYYTKTPPLTH
jgi:selenocysteine lyase/cysteine desulfurase